MNKRITQLLCLLTALALLAPSVAAAPPAPLAADAGVLSEAAEPDARAAYAQLPLYFIENQGQTDARVAYYTQQGGANIYFTPEEVAMNLPSPQPSPEGRGGKTPLSLSGRGAGGEGGEGVTGDTGGTILRLQFRDANPAVRIEGTQAETARFNYFLGNDPAQWHSDVPSYGEIAYRDLYPGIDLYYTGRAGELKSTFVLQPGAQVTDIRLQYAGAEGLHLAANGDLVIATAAGELRDTAPYVYQEIAGERVTVAAAFTLYDAQTYGFTVGSYDPRYPLVIDPLLYSTFLGGSSYDVGYGIAVAASGAVYVTEYTDSSDFPTTPGAYDEDHNGNYDGFVSVLAADLSTLTSATFLGGSDNDYGYDIAVAASGAVYVTGRTYSGDFPTTTGAYDEDHNGSADVFVSVLPADLRALTYSTFLGGSSADYAFGIALAASGAVYVTGYTNSSEDFPTTDGAYNTIHNGGGHDAFVSVLAADLSALAYGTFLVGSGDDRGYGIALAASGAVYVTGYTASSNFPTTAGAYDETHNGSYDVFVSVLAADLSALISATFLGGSSPDYGSALALADSGAVYVTGYTNSSEDFPITDGAYNTIHNGGGYDAFVSGLAADLSALAYGTFLGGSSYEHGRAIAVAASGAVYVTGDTHSNDFPTTTGAYDQSYNGGAYDAFVSVFGPASLPPDAMVPTLGEWGLLAFVILLGGYAVRKLRRRR